MPVLKYPYEMDGPELTPVLEYPYEMDGPELTPVLEYPYEMDGPELTKDQIIDLFIAMGYEYVKVIDLVRGEDYEPAEV